MQKSDMRQGFQSQADYEDVKKFISSFEVEKYGLLGKVVMGLEPFGGGGGQVAIGEPLDAGSGAHSVSIPLALASEARAPRGPANKLEAALLDAVARSMLNATMSHAAEPAARSAADVAVCGAAAEKDVGEKLGGKLRARASLAEIDAKRRGPAVRRT